MSIAWGSLLVVCVVSIAIGVAIVALAAFALVGIETRQTTSRDPQAMDMLPSSQAAAVAGTGAGTSLTLWALTGRRWEAA